MEKPFADHLFKIIIMGDSGVGKTSIIHRFTDDIFKDAHQCTIGVDFKIKTVLYRSKTIKLMLYDTAGSEKFRSLSKSFYRGSNAVLFVYDCMDLQSFHGLEKWMEDLDIFLPEEDAPSIVRILVSNKNNEGPPEDPIFPVVDRNEAATFAAENGMEFIECSAKTGYNVDNIFALLIHSLCNDERRPLSTTGAHSIILHDDRGEEGVAQRIADRCC